MKIAIIGGGASGLFCAINIKLKLKEKVEVAILERQNRVGKKILVTGNGKCNLTNFNLSYKDYNTSFVEEALKGFSPQDCIEYFKAIGIMTRQDSEGRVYPYSEKANSVLDRFLSLLDELDIKVITDYEVSHIKRTDKFLVYSKDYRVYNFDFLVMATGGKSAVNFDNDSYQLLKEFNHKVTSFAPGLVALKSDANLKPLSGLRIKAKAKIIEKGKVLAETVGEILFKDNGLSGIAIFELSRFYKPNCTVVLDIAYDKTDEELTNFLSGDLENRLNGLFPKMIRLDILRRNKGNVLDVIRNYDFNIIGTYDYNNAQVTIGGIDYHDINPFTYESLLVKDLYVIGEALNVDGACGGFNLHFAWASAYSSSNDIIEKIIHRKGENEN